MTGRGSGILKQAKERACVECGKKSGVKLAYRLNPVNWHPIHKRLCQVCRTRLGFAVVDYHRNHQRIAGAAHR